MFALAEPSNSRNPDENSEKMWVSHTFLNRSPLITSKSKAKARMHGKFLLVQTKLHFQDLAAVDTSGVLYRLARKNSWPSRQQYTILEEIKKAVADKKSVVLTQVLCLQFHTPLRVLRKNYRPILE